MKRILLAIGAVAIGVTAVVMDVYADGLIESAYRSFNRDVGTRVLIMILICSCCSPAFLMT